MDVTLSAARAYLRACILKQLLLLAAPTYPGRDLSFYVFGQLGLHVTFLATDARLSRYLKCVASICVCWIAVSS